MGNPSIDFRVLIAAGAVTAALGVVVMVGWHGGAMALVQVHPAFVPMQYNTALGFVLAGAACVLLGARRGQVAAIAGAVTTALGLLTLAQYVFGADLGIDRLFVEPYITVEASQPGRMAPNTALGFVLPGARRGRRVRAR